MTSITFKSSSRPLSTGDILLTPLRCCGNRWHSLCVKGNCKESEKISCIARKIILASMLTIATAIAFVPGAVGSLIKSFSHVPSHAPKFYNLNISEDLQIKERCRQIGIDNQKAREEDIADQVIRGLPNTFFSAVGVRRMTSYDMEPSIPSKIICLQSAENDIPFFENLISCFRQPFQEDFNIIKRLPDLILGLKRLSSSGKDINLSLKKIVSGNVVYLEISEDLERMNLTLINKTHTLELIKQLAVGKN